jgi:septal ring factor EnvC (AmiA/AmiB activator)
MSKVNLTQASKMAKISRSTLYNKYIKNGLITVEVIDDKKMIDVSELLRVFSTVQVDDQQIQSSTPDSTENKQENTSQDKIIKMLEDQLLEAKEREEWLRSQITELTELTKQNNKLLEYNQARPRKKIFGLL